MILLQLSDKFLLHIVIDVAVAGDGGNHIINNDVLSSKGLYQRERYQCTVLHYQKK